MSNRFFLPLLVLCILYGCESDSQNTSTSLVSVVPPSLVRSVSSANPEALFLKYTFSGEEGEVQRSGDGAEFSFSISVPKNSELSFLFEWMEQCSNGDSVKIAEVGQAITISDVDTTLAITTPYDYTGNSCITGVLPDMVFIAEGCFQVGSDESVLQRGTDEGPRFNVCVDAFRMGAYEVTFKEYDAFAQATGRELLDDNGWGRGQRPAINVSWIDAIEYAKWLSGVTGKRFRLPTEVEWEYAALGGTDTEFYTGNTITSEDANFNAEFTYNGSSVGLFRDQTLPVGSFLPNPYGLHDILGNVLEWTCSRYQDPYNGAESICEDESTDASEIVVRSGSFFSKPWALRAADRKKATPDTSFPSSGFRLVEELPLNQAMVRIPSGCFDIGSAESVLMRGDDEGPQFNVCVNSFLMSRFEVTFDQYDAFANATSRNLPSDNGWGRNQMPVINVSWNDAVSYAEWLSNETGRRFRLPTESEWEFAARGGTSTEFYTGSTITTDEANFNGEFVYNGTDIGLNRGRPLPVGSFAPNPYGLYDILGNVLEWTCSRYDDPYSGAESNCEVIPTSASEMSIRSGSFFSKPWALRAADRKKSPPDSAFGSSGFRLVEDE